MTRPLRRSRWRTLATYVANRLRALSAEEMQATLQQTATASNIAPKPSS